MKQSGFMLPSPLMLYGAAAVAILVIGLGVAVKVQTSRLASVKAEYAGFVAQTKAIGDAQENLTKAKDAENLKLVQEKDHENNNLHDQLAVTAKRLRDNNSSRSLLSQTASSPGSPNKACYDLAQLNDAIRSFSGDVGELIIEGESNAIDLNTAKEWVKALSSSGN